MAAILSAFLLVTEPGYRVGFSALIADGLAVLLQLLAVWTVTASHRRTGLVLGAALSALAFMTKFSALWAPMAIAAWLAIRKRNGLWLFASTYVVLVAMLIGAAGVVSSGRFFESVFGLSLAGIGAFASRCTRQRSSFAPCSATHQLCGRFFRLRYLASPSISRAGRHRYMTSALSAIFRCSF
jgi:hypothetical protein